MIRYFAKKTRFLQIAWSVWVVFDKITGPILIHAIWKYEQYQAHYLKLATNVVVSVTICLLCRAYVEHKLHTAHVVTQKSRKAKYVLFRV